MPSSPARRAARVRHEARIDRVALATAAIAAGANSIAPPAGEWNFRALLDGKPIGQHRFSDSGEGDERKVVSEAEFAVKLLGITAYRYRHQATEQWHDNCRTALNSTTDDDSKPVSVRVAQNDATLKGCLMSFAYWNPVIQNQTRLLNAQTGKLEAVQVSAWAMGRSRCAASRSRRPKCASPARPIRSSSGIGRKANGSDSIRPSPAAAS